MTADWYCFPPEVLRKISSRITNEVEGINRVTYDISSKPPAVCSMPYAQHPTVTNRVYSRPWSGYKRCEVADPIIDVLLIMGTGTKPLKCACKDLERGVQVDCKVKVMNFVD